MRHWDTKKEIPTGVELRYQAAGDEALIEIIVFGVVFVVALGSSIAMLFAKNAVHAALFLVATQIALALAFLLQGAFFVAAIQIIVYAGAIMVLFLFVIMLLGVDKKEPLIEPLTGQRPLAVGLGALLAAEILCVAWKGIRVRRRGRGRCVRGSWK